MRRSGRISSEGGRGARLGKVSGLLRRLRLFKQIVEIVPSAVDRENELAVFVGATPRLFDFEAVVGSGMEPYIRQANIRQPFPDLAYSMNDLGQSNSVGKQL